MKRGDIITVALSGDYGKPRPAVIIQSDLLADTDSVLLCLITSSNRDAPLFRVALPAGQVTGLRRHSQVMVDKIMAARRERCGTPIGRLDAETMAAVSRSLMFVTGVVD